MFIRKPIIILFVAAIVFLLAFAWYKVSTVKVDTVRYYHGLCNSGVGDPYADLTHRLRLLFETGKTNELGRALISADKHSGDIYDVWLDDKVDAYRASVHEILK